MKVLGRGLAHLVAAALVGLALAAVAYADNGNGNGNGNDNSGAAATSQPADNSASAPGQQNGTTAPGNSENTPAASNPSDNGNGNGASGNGNANGQGNGNGNSGNAPGQNKGSQGSPSPNASPKAQHHVIICHRTGSASHPWVVINIDIAAWPAHQAHGDKLLKDPAKPQRRTAACSALARGRPRGVAPCRSPAHRCGSSRRSAACCSERGSRFA